MALTDVKDINLDLDTRERFSINGDATKIVVLDTKDLNIVSRLSGAVKKIAELQKKWDDLSKQADDIISEDDSKLTLDKVSAFNESFDNLEHEMREVVDGIFDSPGMCDTILEDSSIFSLKDGKFKYDIIIDKFTNLYEVSIKQEVDKIDRKKVATKTSKYIRNK